MNTWEPPAGAPPVWFHRDLSLGDEGEDVKIVQRKVDAPMSGTYDDETAARVRGVQKKVGLPQSGEVDADVAKVLGEKPGAGQKPEWYNHPVKRGDLCECVARVRVLLRQANLPVDFDQDLEDVVRRFQSEHELPLTGEVDEDLATLLNDRVL